MYRSLLIRLASHSVIAPNSRSGGHEFESPVWGELGALTKVEKSLGSGLSSLHPFQLIKGIKSFPDFYQGRTVCLDKKREK
jgi:hypothetical protein